MCAGECLQATLAEGALSAAEPETVDEMRMVAMIALEECLAVFFVIDSPSSGGAVAAGRLSAERVDFASLVRALLDCSVASGSEEVFMLSARLVCQLHYLFRGWDDRKHIIQEVMKHDANVHVHELTLHELNAAGYPNPEGDASARHCLAFFQDLADLPSSEESAGGRCGDSIFFTTDIPVMIDVILRESFNLPPESELRLQYLILLKIIVNGNKWVTAEQYRQDALKDMLLELSDSSPLPEVRQQAGAILRDRLEA